MFPALSIAEIRHEFVPLGLRDLIQEQKLPHNSKHFLQRNSLDRILCPFNMSTKEVCIVKTKRMREPFKNFI